MVHIKKKLNISVLLSIGALTQIIWGFVPSGSQIIIKQIPVELYITLRWSISSSVFLLILAYKNHLKIKINRHFFEVAFVGILGMGLCSLGNAYGVFWGGVTIVALVGSLSSLIKTVCSVIFLHEKPKKMFWLALLLSIAGLVLLVFGKYQISSFEAAILSAAIVFFSTILDGFMFAFSKKRQASYSPSQYLVVTQTSAALFMWAMQFFYFQQVSQLSQLNPTGWFALLYVSLVAGVICYFIYYWVLSQIDGHRLAIFDGLHTLSATFFGIILFNESLNMLMFLGGGMVLSALVIANIKALNK